MLGMLTNPLCYVPAGRDDPHSLLPRIPEGCLDQMATNASAPLWRGDVGAVKLEPAWARRRIRENGHS
jgi:hypothetical protein